MLGFRVSNNKGKREKPDTDSKNKLQGKENYTGKVDLNKMSSTIFVKLCKRWQFCSQQLGISHEIRKFVTAEIYHEQNKYYAFPHLSSYFMMNMKSLSSFPYLQWFQVQLLAIKVQNRSNPRLSSFSFLPNMKWMLAFPPNMSAAATLVRHCALNCSWHKYDWRLPASTTSSHLDCILCSAWKNRIQCCSLVHFLVHSRARREKNLRWHTEDGRVLRKRLRAIFSAKY